MVVVDVVVVVVEVAVVAVGALVAAAVVVEQSRGNPSPARPCQHQTAPMFKAHLKAKPT